jgi:hypothetical protein
LKLVASTTVGLSSVLGLVEIAVAIGADGRDQGHLRREVDEVASKEFEIGMDGAEFDLAAEQHARDTRRLWSGVEVVEPARDALFEHIEMPGQHDAGLDHVKIVDLGWIDIGERSGEDVRLLLVVAFQTNAVARPNHDLQKIR